MSETIQNVRRFWPIIQEQAEANKLRPELLAGLICQESGGNPYSLRVEPDFSYIPEDFALARPGGMSMQTEFWGRKISWGLCQLMGQVARELGFRGWFPALCEPDIGLRYGALKLSQCLAARKGDERAALLRYNGGGNKKYPDQVFAWAALFTQGEKEA